MILNNNRPVNYRNVTGTILREQYYGDINIFCAPKNINLSNPSL